VGILLMFVLPFLIGIWIGWALNSWSVAAITVGVPLFIPPTATLIPALISTRADSIWFYAIPTLGAGLFFGGLAGVVKLVTGLFRRGFVKG